MRWASGGRHPFEDNPFVDGFLGWIEAPDLVFDALEHAGVDARQRKIVRADGKRLSIEQSAERIHAEHPGVPRYLIETHVLGWLENCAPDSASERQLEELDRLIEPWLDDHERTSRAPESSRELGTLEIIREHRGIRMKSCSGSNLFN